MESASVNEYINALGTFEPTSATSVSLGNRIQIDHNLVYITIGKHKIQPARRWLDPKKFILFRSTGNQLWVYDDETDTWSQYVDNIETIWTRAKAPEPFKKIKFRSRSL